ncbi:acyltransferase [Brevibacillus sp. TJ4]|uniref:acyltransferase n=1 Tax=Brevibacillus sp. TJ4 TaxID=3234853 RepID=UPI003B9FAA4C
MSRKERIAELELVRAFGFLAVVYQHVLGVYMQAPNIDEQTAVAYGMLFHLLKFAVPAFIFITGFVLFYNYYEKIPYLSFMQKRGKEILLPYLLWSAIYFLLAPRLDGENSLIWNVAKIVGTGSASYHLWFVVMIFQFYLFYPLWQRLFRFLRRHSGTVGKFVIVAGLTAGGYALLMWFSARYIPAQGFRFDQAWLDAYLIKYRDRNALYYFFYFLMGGVGAISLPLFRAKVKQHWLSITGLFLLLYAYIGYELFRDSGDGLINLNVATSLKPSMFVYTVFQLLLVYLVALLLSARPNRLTAWLTEFGKHSFGAYLVHALVLTYVMKGLRSVELFHTGIMGSFVAFVLCSLISFGVSYGISKIPFGYLLVGSAPKKQKRAIPVADNVRKEAM